MLEGIGITKRFGGLAALSGVSFQVAPGEVVGLIGPNGAGKTTLFNIISGLIRPSAGHVRLAGTDIARLPPYRIARLWPRGRSALMKLIFGAALSVAT